MSGGISSTTETDPALGETSRLRLEIFISILEKWNPAINLVSPASLAAVWDRHVADSVQVLQLCPPDAQHWVDLGSGGGFPGMVVAILAADRYPNLGVTLVESDQRKAVFLRTVSAETGVGVNVIAERIEKTKRLDADVVSARALAPLAQLCGYADRHLNRGGTALFMKGAHALAEIDEARQAWKFSLTVHPSTTEPTATILKLLELSHV